MLSHVLLSAIQELGPCFICENTSLVSIFNLSLVKELEACAIKFKDSLDSWFSDGIFQTSILLSIQVEIVLWIILLLNVLRHLLQVSSKISAISINNVGYEELNELLFTSGDFHLRNAFHL